MKKKSVHFSLVIVFYIILGSYLLYNSFKEPLLGILLENRDGDWYVEDIYNYSWAESVGLSKSDVLLKVDGMEIEELKSVSYDQRIRTAEQITFYDHETRTFKKENVEYSDGDLVKFNLLVPVIYFIVMVFLTFYLYKVNQNSKRLLIYLILSISLAYISGNASSRLDWIGMITNSVCLVLCPILFIHFVVNHFNHLTLKLVPKGIVPKLYIIPFICAIANLSIYFIERLYTLQAFLVLAIFSFLFLYIILILSINYIFYKEPKFKMLFLSIIIPILPFLALYALPLVLIGNYFVSAETTIIYLLLIPFSFVFFNIEKQLFDIEFYISNLKYYSSFSIVFTTLTFLIFKLWIDMPYWYLPITFILVLCMFYLKEVVDYKQRKILAYSNSNDTLYLYSSIIHLNKAKNEKDLKRIFLEIVRNRLKLEEITFISNNEALKQFTRLEKYKPCVGEIISVSSKEYLIFATDLQSKEAYLHLNSTYGSLYKTDLLWLELITVYLDTHLKNMKQIKDLLCGFEEIKDESSNQWLNKLGWQLIEKEKRHISQEIHNHFLQEILYVARKVDLVTYEENQDKILDSLKSIRLELLDTAEVVREYCEYLCPPLLDTIGIKKSIKKFEEKIRVRADFTLNMVIEDIYCDNTELTLIIFRTIQELLNNALKHSHAEHVNLELKEVDKYYIINYSDNGIGGDLNEMINKEGSFGFKSIINPIKSYNGVIKLGGESSEGLNIQIYIPKKEEVEDG